MSTEPLPRAISKLFERNGPASAPSSRISPSISGSSRASSRQTQTSAVAASSTSTPVLVAAVVVAWSRCSGRSLPPATAGNEPEESPPSSSLLERPIAITSAIKIRETAPASTPPETRGRPRAGAGGKGSSRRGGRAPPGGAGVRLWGAGRGSSSGAGGGRGGGGESAG